MREKIAKILPEYSWLPLTVCIVFDLLVFYATRPITAGWHHYDISVALDAKIPFIPAFIVIYILSYVQWGLGFLTVGRESRDFCFRYIFASLVSRFICLIIFIVLPTAMTRPDVPGKDIFSWMTSFIYSVDTPDNLFPSIHCVESTFFAYTVFRSRKVKPALKWINLFFTVSVYFAVLFVKQHLVLDVIAGIIITFIGIIIAHYVRPERFFLTGEKETEKTLIQEKNS